MSLVRGKFGRSVRRGWDLEGMRVRKSAPRRIGKMSKKESCRNSGSVPETPASQFRYISIDESSPTPTVWDPMENPQSGRLRNLQACAT